MSTLNELFDIRRATSILDVLKVNINKKCVVFEEEKELEDSYYAAKKSLQECLMETDANKETEVNQLLYKFVRYPSNCDTQATLIYVLRLYHFTLLKQVDLDILDHETRNEIAERFSNFLLVSVPDANDQMVIKRIFQMSETLRNTISMPTNASPNDPEGNSSNTSISSNSTFSISNNNLIGYMGLFYPVYSNRERLPKLRLYFSYNQLFKVEGIVETFQRKTIDNERSIQLQMSFLLEGISKVLRSSFDNISHSAETSYPIVIQDKTYLTRPDLVIKLAKGEKQMSIPFECKNVRIDDIMNRFRAYDPLSAGSYSYCHLYSQLIRESITCSVNSGFMAGSDRLYFIRFHDVLSDRVVRAKEIATAISCQLFPMTNGLEIAKALLWTFVQPVSNFKEKVIRYSYVEDGISTVIVPYYYQRLRSVYLEIEEELNYADNESEMRSSEVDSNRSLSTAISLQGLGLVDMNDRQFRMIHKLSKYFGSKWRIQNFEDLLQQYKIEVVQGRRFKFNSAVLKLTRRRDERVSIMKILDPMFSKMAVGKRTDLKACFHNCIQQFLKESYCYKYLEKEPFIPKLYNIGIINNNNHSYQENVLAENPSLSGFYLEISYIEGRRLAELDAREKLHYQQRLFHCVRSMNKKRIFHCDITGSNIIIDKNGKPVIIDYGMTKVYKKRTKIKGYKRNSSITLQQKAAADREALSRALGIPMPAIFDIMVNFDKPEEDENEDEDKNEDKDEEEEDEEEEDEDEEEEDEDEEDEMDADMDFAEPDDDDQEPESDIYTTSSNQLPTIPEISDTDSQ